MWYRYIIEEEICCNLRLKVKVRRIWMIGATQAKVDLSGFLRQIRE